MQFVFPFKTEELRCPPLRPNLAFQLVYRLPTFPYVIRQQILKQLKCSDALLVVLPSGVSDVFRRIRSFVFFRWPGAARRASRRASGNAQSELLNYKT